ncbi:unnamed protein product [Gordionus sp. m RMFG-2023]|uniref:mitochondrial translation release factor in rescue-like n=1 Tax=Gordionus sp. m RMFG-2023 TaxID=3053472 RepID=UPI0030E14AE2
MIFLQRQLIPIISFLKFASSRPNLKNLYPPVKEEELEEHFIKGCGPGGSKINKSINCVLLKHLPTGIFVKCQQDRALDTNRKIARFLLQERLDTHYNGENSIVALRNRSEIEKEAKNAKRAQSRREKLAKYKDLLKQSNDHQIQ